MIVQEANRGVERGRTEVHVPLRYRQILVPDERLNRRRRRWRKMKGSGWIRLRSGRVRLAELHWYEAHGIGKKEVKRKWYLD